jgi:hypothetical protein
MSSWSPLSPRSGGSLRKNSFLFPYTRAAIFSRVAKEKLGASLLAYLAATEASMIWALVKDSGCRDEKQEAV